MKIIIHNNNNTQLARIKEVKTEPHVHYFNTVKKKTGVKMRTLI